jgi:hypothetical protein
MAEIKELFAVGHLEFSSSIMWKVRKSMVPPTGNGQKDLIKITIPM